MRYLWQHINSITANYDGSLPLVHYLKHYYKQFPKLGSRDRRMLSTIIYSWYRSAKAMGVAGTEHTEMAVRSCLVACGVDLAPFERLLPDVQAPASVDTELLLPSQPVMSTGIDRRAWLGSMLHQPDLFIRVRKNKKQLCLLLEQHGIPYSFTSDACLRLPNGAAVDKILPADSYVVQDASSQETGNYFQPAAGQQWYDCCSGAGGKSLLLMDKGIKVNLTVSDKRASILHNLGERFRLYGHRQPTSIVADASDTLALTRSLGDRKFDNIICDVPCSGSGTWARTPEQLYFFDPASIDQFSTLQCQIATNVSNYLKPGGSLIYITCSVFRQENEQVVESVARTTGLTLKSSRLINGIERRSDSMFIAVLG
ncbi:MAG: hypothetical protein KF744_00520 [Taibaiella sp.]|nr:hypothetical protein [Taibaiella sp.]